MNVVNDCLVSIVVPIYNSAAYLDEFYKCFCEQTFKNFELICVVDGATDNSLDIVKNYCNNNENFKYIVHDDNLGAGVARNSGYRLAKGKYIIFVDADDLYDKDFVYELYNNISNNDSDISMCLINETHYRLNREKKDFGFNTNIYIENTNINPLEVDNFYLSFEHIPINKIFNKNFLDNLNIEFSDTYSSNDMFFVLAAMSSATKINTVHKSLIFRRKELNPESITSNRDKSTHCGPLEMERFYFWLKDNDLLDKFLLTYINQFSLMMFYNSSFKENQLFINESARILSTSEPWKDMSEVQINDLLDLCLNTDKMIKRSEKQLENNVDDNYTKQFIIMNENRINTINKIKKLAETKYKKNTNYCGIYKKDINDNIKISVIIPIYNQEKYIKQCLDSVINQKLKEIEIICVNDGSTDKSPLIVAQYSLKDKRIIIINKYNEGVGSARNDGLKLAKGEYMAFIDPDDYYYSLDALEELYTKAIENKAPICGGTFVSLVDDKIEKSSFDTRKQECIFKNEGFVNYHDYQFDFDYQRYIYNRKMIIDNNIYMPNYIRYQDPPWFVRVMHQAKKFYVIPKKVYMYRAIKKSLSKKQNIDIIKGITDVMTFAKNHNYDELCKLETKRLRIEKSQSLYPYIIDGDEEVISLLNKFDEILNDSKSSTLIILSNIINKNNEKIKNINNAIADKDKLINDLNNKITELNSIHGDNKNKINNITNDLNYYKNELDIAHNSYNYKVGHYILYIPKKIYYFFKRFLKK